MSRGLQDRRDVDFLVKEVFKVDSLFAAKAYEEQNFELFDMVMDSAWKLAHEALYPAMGPTDIEGLTYDDGEVRTPEVFKSLWKAYKDGGWISIAEPMEHGGAGLPKSLALQATTLLAGSNLPFFLLPGLCHGAGEMIATVGNDAQRELYVPKLYSGEWGGTMCLTEPGAGSDVGSLRATARQAEDGSWHITGTKIFITWGEHDLTDNIVYPVLARVEGDPKGSKGITLFLVSKYHLDAQGNLGARNGVKCTKLEEKMGVHTSPTCEITFGADAPAVGEMLGERCGGMKAMFRMMNTARIAVGIQSLCLTEAAYRYAHQYALDRQQGSSVENFKDPEAPRIAIIKHPDVRRMLLDMRAAVEGMRALLTYACFQLDVAHVSESDADRQSADDVLAFLTPIVKGYASELAFEQVGNAVLVLGGHGYLRDHPVEQYMRDTVIARLWEGTTGIQALDLVGRKLGAKGGMVLMNVLMKMDETVAAAREAGLGEMADSVAAMRESFGMTAMHLGQQFGGGDLGGPLLSATGMLQLAGDTVLSWLHLMMANTAQAKAEKSTWHANKVLTARHFIQNAVHRVKARAGQISSVERAALAFKFEDE